MSLTCMQQHMCVQTALESEAPPTLRAVERLLRVCSVHSLMGFELDELGEGLLAVLTAQRLLARTLATTGLGLY